MKKNELLIWVKEELIFSRLRLEDMGIDLSEVEDETLLFSDQGLALDSIDGLELAVGIEQHFGLKINQLTAEVAQEKFKHATAIVDFIVELQEINALTGVE